MTDDPLMTPEQAAKMLSSTKRFLQLDRSTKREIPFIKVGRLVRYSRTDLNAYIQSQRVSAAD